MTAITEQRRRQALGLPTPNDLVQRLRDRAYSGLPDPLSEQAAQEIERLRLTICRLAEQDATLSVQGGNVTVTMDATLTNEEREALESAIWDYEQNDDDEDCARMVSTLRGLLERTKTV